MNLHGVYVAVATPFDSSGKISELAFEKHLHWLAQAGVHGFVPCGTTGESPVLDSSERELLIQRTCKIAEQYGIGVIAGCGSNSTELALRHILAAKDLGCEAALVVTPYYNKPTQGGLLEHYRYLSQKGGLPIVLYNVPGRTNVNLLPETVASLFIDDNIIGLKEASGQWGQWVTLSNGSDLRKKHLFAGDDNAVAPIMALGGCGVISACANVAPKGFVRLVTAARAGDWAEAFRIQRKLNNLVTSLFLETSPAPIKFALSFLNRVPGYPATLRLPLVPVGENTETCVREALQNLEADFDL